MPGSGYDRIPTHMQSGGHDANLMSRFLTQDEMRRYHPTQAMQLARQRAEEARMSGAMAGAPDDEPLIDGESQEGKPRKMFYRSTADFSGEGEQDERELAARRLWGTHVGSAVIYGGLAIAMIVFMGVYSWDEHHQIGKFPLESNFIHLVMGSPVNEERVIGRCQFFWILWWIPFVGAIYHYCHTREHYFAGYFNDNIVHHVGSLKYGFLALCGGLIAFSVFVLVGIVDLPFLVVLGLMAAYVFVQLHAVVWQNGRNNKHQQMTRVNARKTAAAMFTEVVGVNPDMPDSLHAGAPGDFVNDTANVANQAVYDTSRVVADAVGTTNAVFEDVAGLMPSEVRRGINRILETILPADLVLAPYISAGLLQLALHIFVLLYWGEALSNAGWHTLPWIANFAAIFYLLPTALHVTAFVLYFFQIGHFKWYAYHEMLVLGANTVTTCVYVAIVFFFSTQFGTIYV